MSVNIQTAAPKHEPQGISNRIPTWIFLTALVLFGAFMGYQLTWGNMDTAIIPGWVYLGLSVGVSLYLALDIHDEVKASQTKSHSH